VHRDGIHSSKQLVVKIMFFYLAHAWKGVTDLSMRQNVEALMCYILHCTSKIVKYDLHCVRKFA